jgi:hypothetical protein
MNELAANDLLVVVRRNTTQMMPKDEEWSNKTR